MSQTLNKIPLIQLFKLVLLTLLFQVPVFSQQSIYPLGDPILDETATTICLAPNGDYIIGGYQESDALIIRMQPDGTIVWSKSYAINPLAKQIKEIIYTSGNSIVAVGTSIDGSVAGSFVMSVDNNGTLEWVKEFQAPSTYQFGKAIAESGNGNLRALGVYINNFQEPYVAELDPTTGNMIWDSIYVRNNIGNDWDESKLQIKTNPLNGASYICGRNQTAQGNQSYRCELTRLNANGGYAWTKNYFYPIGTTGGRLYSYALDFDNDSIVVNIVGQNQGSNTPFDFGLFKTDTLGNLAWSRYYSSSNNYDLRTYHLITVPGGYVMAGYTNSGANNDLFLVKTDDQGTVLWSKKYGTNLDENIGTGAMTSRLIYDGNKLVTVGRSYGFSNSADIVLLQVDLQTGLIDGNGCSSDLLLTEETLPQFQMDYPLLVADAGLVQTTPSAVESIVSIEQSAGLVENVTDTLVSNDTLHICSSVDIRADWNPNYSFLWSTGNTNQIETINTTGTYWVEVSSNGCTFAVDTVHVVVSNPVVNLGPDTTICDNGTILLDATYPNASYLWQDNSTNATFNVTASGTYFVEVTEAGCSAYDTIIVTYIQQPGLDLGNDTTICQGQTLLLDATNIGTNTYQWQDNSTNPTYTVQQSGIYSVTVDNGCPVSDTIVVNSVPIPTVNLGPDTTLCDSGAILLDATYPNASYLWQDNSTNATFNVTASGTYFVEVTEAGCSAYDTIIVTYIQPPSVDLGNDTTICQGQAFALDVSGQGSSFLWSDGSTSSSYVVTQSESIWVEVFINGCSDADTVNIMVLPYPIIDLGPDSAYCDEIEITLDATFPNATYLWQDGASNATYVVTSSGTYWVTVSNGICQFTDSISLSLDTTPIVDLGTDTTLCTGTSITLDPSVAGANYQWQDGSQAPSFDAASPGLYWVEVTNGNCSSSDTITLSYIDAPNVTLNDTSLCTGETLLVDASIENGTYLWTDGSTNAAFLVQEEGIYSVEIENPCGTQNVSFAVQEKFCLCDLYVPNSFTPDGDEINHSFGALTSCPVYKFQLLIFNRWGEVIFESNDINYWWDGTYQGKDVQDGIYTWKIIYDFADDTDDPNEITGHVTVLR